LLYASETATGPSKPFIVGKPSPVMNADGTQRNCFLTNRLKQLSSRRHQWKPDDSSVGVQDGVSPLLLVLFWLNANSEDPRSALMPTGPPNVCGRFLLAEICAGSIPKFMAEHTWSDKPLTGRMENSVAIHRFGPHECGPRRCRPSPVPPASAAVAGFFDSVPRSRPCPPARLTMQPSRMGGV